MRFCPVCNGFRKVKCNCLKCGTKMKDMGRRQDFEDKYSAYGEIEYVIAVDSSLTSLVTFQCIHLMQCEHCGEDVAIAVDF